ncbi:MAG: immunoglobulin domain-containing protein [Opitutaceae bacterium]|nr:immunoglobulin domain-containing protein [Opitutaceae bacterium]
MNFRTLLAVGAFSAAVAAQAVTTVATNGVGELVLGFSAPSVDVNVEVALGTAANLFGSGMNYTAFNASIGQNLYQVGRLDVADLSAHFGEWQNRADISWAIVGYSGTSLNNTTWASKDVDMPGTQTAPWNRGTAAAQNGNFGSGVSKMAKALALEVGVSLEYSAVDGSNPFTSIVNVGTLGGNDSWSKQVLTTNQYVQIDLQADTVMTVTPAFSGGVTVADLYQMASGSSGTPGTYIGTFGIDAQGVLWYANNAAAFSPAAGPVITNPPASVIKAPGDDTFFTVAATGTGTLTYQWQVQLLGAGAWADVVADPVYSTVTTPTLTLTAVTANMSTNKYRCLVTDTAGTTTSVSATLTVTLTPVAPTITTQPLPLNLRDGTSGTFTVVATGSLPLNYQWQFRVASADWANATNAAPYSGATSDTLTVTTATSMNGTLYRCVVTNTAGTATSNTATLSVSLPPVIITQPLPQTVPVGATATFTGAATSNVTLTFTWQVLTSPSSEWTTIAAGAPYAITTDSTTTPGTASSTLTVGPATAEMNGRQYRFAVSDGPGGSNSNFALLTVGDAGTASVITTQPLSITKVDGASAAFTVAATGTPPLAYQWQWKSAATAWANIPASSDYSGATTATLTINPVTMAMSGNEYRCTVSNTTGVATSDVVTLTVTPAPVVITSQPASKSVVAGTNTTFTVNATGTTPITYQWKVTANGTEWTAITNAAPYSDATTAELKITAVPKSLTGYGYRCIVTNAAGAVTSTTAVLTVTDAIEGPAIVTQPSSITITRGAPATFTVTVTGTSPTYQWRKGGAAIAGAISSSYTIAHTADADAGAYSVVVSNSAGSVTSIDASLTVVAAPVIDPQPVDTGAALGSSATLTVGATGNGLSYQWFRGGVPVTGASASSLAFAAVAPADAGIYDCLVSDGTGGEILSKPVVLGVTLPAGTRTAGAVSTYLLDIQHPNGAIYDQFLLNGAAGTFSAAPNKIARMSFLDGHDSIVQVEMSGAGSITVVLTGATGPIDPIRYTQTGIQYMKGKATVILAGADASTHFTIYSVGRFTNPGVTRDDGGYYGWADVAVAGIISTNGGLGGIHQGNVEYNAAVGYTGLYAPSVTSVAQAPVIHDIDATVGGTAEPYLYFGPAGSGADGLVTVKMAGGDLKQNNDFNVTVSGLVQVQMVAGQSSNGVLVPGQLCQAHLVNDAGVDVTERLVTGP